MPAIPIAKMSLSQLHDKGPADGARLRMLCTKEVAEQVLDLFDWPLEREEVEDQVGGKGSHGSSGKGEWASQVVGRWARLETSCQISDVLQMQRRFA